MSTHPKDGGPSIDPVALLDRWAGDMQDSAECAALATDRAMYARQVDEFLQASRAVQAMLAESECLDAEIERLREQWADAEARNVTLATVQRERDELRARVAELEAERDAAFKMSRCECDSEEACANLAALHRKVAELEAARGEPVAYLHQVVCGDGEPDQALSFAPDNFPLAGVLGYRSLSHEPLYTAPPAPVVDESQPADQYTAECVEIDGHTYGLRPGAARVVREALRDAERWRLARTLLLMRVQETMAGTRRYGLMVRPGYSFFDALGDPARAYLNQNNFDEECCRVDEAFDAAMAKDGA